MTFEEKYERQVDKNNSLLCVGLDPVLEKLPPHIQKTDYPFFTFNKAIIDATSDVVAAYKPNSAFYEARGAQGIEELKKTCDYLRQNYPEVPIILDYKRGDIGNTNNEYTVFAFDYLQVDAVTLQPYPGIQTLQVFLDYKDKGIILLCRTSNPGSGEFQDLLIDGEPLYLRVAKNVMEKWNTHKNCLLVVGATYPEELAKVRKIVGDMTLLIPGLGAQGGDLGGTMQAGINSRKKGMIMSASRGIIFAGDEEDFAQKAREEAKKLRDEINTYR